MNSIHKIISIVAVLYLLKHVHREDQHTINVEVQEHVVAKKLQKKTPQKSVIRKVSNGRHIGNA